MNNQPKLITHRLAAFTAYLREHGFSLGPQEQMAMLNSLGVLQPLQLN